MPDSLIYCVSIGCERTLTLVPKSGSGAPQNHPLPSGSVYTMPTQTQSTWQHCVPADHLINQPRVSFTFRRLRPVRTDPPIETEQNDIESLIPPIKNPRKNNRNKVNILFVTDSILKGTLPSSLIRSRYNMEKRVLYKLTDVISIAPEFPHYDIVVLSTGINDISRYGHTANELFHILRDKLVHVVESSPNTAFIYRSLLPTSINWLSEEVYCFNNSMFRLSQRLNNLYYYDTYSIEVSHEFCNIKGNGIHIPHRIASFLTEQVLRHACFLHYHRTLRWGIKPTEPWPLRPSLRARLR